MDVSIVIPAFNEEDRIGSVLVKLEDSFRDIPALQRLSYEVLVIADGCTDKTAEKIEKFAEANPAYSCISYEKNRGKGFAIRTGVAAAQGKVIFFMDADGSTSVEAMPHFIDLINTDADIVIGSRRSAGANITAKQPIHRRLVGKACSIATQVLLKLPFQDTQCGFKAFKSAVAKDIFARATTDGFAIDIEILTLAKRLGYRIEEIGITWKDNERSSVKALSDGLDMFRKIISFRSLLKTKRD